MFQFCSSSLLICDYYDSLVNQIDLYSEELLEKYNEDDLMPNQPDPILSHSDDGYIDEDEYMMDENQRRSYSSEYNYAQIESLKVEPGVTKVRDYINQVRFKQIDSIKNVQKHNLNMYEMNKLAYKIDRDEINDAKIEELKSRLFDDKFCFLTMITNIEKSQNKCLYQLYLVVTDFYMSPSDQETLGKVIPGTKSSSRFNTNLNENYLLIHLCKEYLVGLWRTQNYGIETIEITKKYLLTIEKVTLNYIMDDVNLDVDSCQLDLSTIKSLEINEEYDVNAKNPYRLVSMRAFSNLEVIKVKRLKLEKFSLLGLNEMLELKIEDCNFSELDFSYLTSLQLLKIVNVQSPIDFGNLTNLKSLYLSNPGNVNLEKVLSEIKLENLVSLSLKNNDHSRINKQLFQGFPNLTHLNLSDNQIEDLSFLNSEYLSNLEYLNLDGNDIKTLKPNQFANLSELNVLCLDFNPLFKLGHHAFRGLNKLELLRLKLDKNFQTLETDCFSGLIKLRELHLRISQVRKLDPDVFIHTPRLEKLMLFYSDCSKLNENTFMHLKNLKSIYFGFKKSDMQINHKVLDSFKKANIKINYLY